MGSCHSEQEYFALDITSTSSYSELVDDVEWGYNRGYRKLPHRTSSFARQQVAGKRKDIDCVQNTIVVSDDSMRAVSKESAWDKEHKAFTHIYSAQKAFQRREGLYANVVIIREEAEKFPAQNADDIEHKKYLNIRRSEKTGTGYTVNTLEDVGQWT